jgi:hypothetical protein
MTTQQCTYNTINICELSVADYKYLLVFDDGNDVSNLVFALILIFWREYQVAAI